MTQQPYYPPQYPVAPPPPQAYPPAYAPQPVPQQYMPGVQAPQAAPPQVPLATGTIDDYYNQPTTGGGKSISWDQKPIGTTYVGIVARDVTNGDIQQQTNFQTKQPETYRDGRPKFVMKVPLNVNPQQFPEFPEGEATLFVRGRMRDELVRAMAEAGCSGAPTSGATIQITLAGKKPSGQGMNPANVFAIVYVPAAGAAATSPAAAPQPVAQPVQAPQPVAVPQAQPAAPVYAQAAPQPAVDFSQLQVPQAAPVAQPAAVAAPVQAQPALAVPANLSPEQQVLLAQIQGAQA
jgi:hypothetical protein